MLGAVRNRPKMVLVGAVVGVVALAGAAIAAILLTTSIGGEVTATTKQARDQVTSVEVVESDGLQCNGWSNDGEGIVFHATATEVVGEDGSTGEDTLSGSCDFQVSIKNVGDVPLHVESLNVDLPDGWSRELISQADDDNKFGPGESETATYRLSANDNAKSGQITGEFTTTTDPS